jgi:putrescine transport system ATP-binding protein
MATPKSAIKEVQPWNDPNAEPYLRIENVTKRFGDFTAVDSVSLSIYKTEVFCLLGGSGCGKSTLLRMLAGFETLTDGRISIDGVDMAGIPPYERPVNMMFQSYALFPHMTVESNVAFGLKMDGIANNEVERRVKDMIELVKLGPFAKRKPHQLSGGQRQRVALARSLVKQPKLLLLDEPLGALDKKLREETQFELINIQEELGVTFVVVTHDQEESMTLSSRIGVMNEGEIIQIGTPTEIYEYPNSRYVADFIGSVNIFEGRIVEDEPDHVLIESDEAGCPLYIDHGVSVTPGAHVWVAVRPEKMEITREDPLLSQNCVKAVVDEIAYMGGLSIYHVVLAGGKKLRITQPNRLRTASEQITWEDEVFLSWDPSSGVVLTS